MTLFAIIFYWLLTLLIGLVIILNFSSWISSIFYCFWPLSKSNLTACALIPFKSDDWLWSKNLEFGDTDFDLFGLILFPGLQLLSGLFVILFIGLLSESNPNLLFSYSSHIFWIIYDFFFFITDDFGSFIWLSISWIYCLICLLSNTSLYTFSLVDVYPATGCSLEGAWRTLLVGDSTFMSFSKVLLVPSPFIGEPDSSSSLSILSFSWTLYSWFVMPMPCKSICTLVVSSDSMLLSGIGDGKPSPLHRLECFPGEDLLKLDTVPKLEWTLLSGLLSELLSGLLMDCLPSSFCTLLEKTPFLVVSWCLSSFPSHMPTWSDFDILFSLWFRLLFEWDCTSCSLKSSPAFSSSFPKG